MSKNFVTYDETLAQELKEKYNLKETTLRVWKHRQGIPTRYFQEGGYKPDELASAGQREKLIHALQLPYLNRNHLGMPTHRCSDLLRQPKHVRLGKDEARAVLQGLKKLRKLLEIFYQKMDIENFQKICEQEEFKVSLLIGDRKLYNRLRQRQTALTEAEQEALRARLQVIFQEFNP